MVSIKKLISGTVIAVCLALPQKANAGSSAEIMAGNKGTTLDLKVAAELAPHLELFSRNLPSVNYDNEVNYFGLVSLGYNLWDGLNVLAQTQFIPEVGAAPRLGLEYFKQIRDFGFYVEAVSTIEKNPQVELLVNIGYQPVTEDLRFVANLEAITLLSEKGHDYSAQKLRLGLGAGKYEVGPAINLEEVSGEVNYNVGGFIKVNF